MISKPFDDITKSDIDALIQDEVRESRTIEYKQSLPGNTDEEKREFLADISSFANGGGGDLLYGIKEIEGVPQEVIGLDCNMDAEIQRFESLNRDCLDPRIQGLRMAPINGFSKSLVLLVRVPRSWAAPHMVKFKNSSRFYTRNSAGKHQMDVTEIRAAFLLSEALPERIRRFRDERLGKIIAGEMPLPLSEGPRLVLHILPVASFSADFSLDISASKESFSHLKLMGGYYGLNRFNLDGFVTWNPNNQKNSCCSYCQIFRQGQIESVSTEFVLEPEGKRYIASVPFEKNIINFVYQCLDVLKKLEVPSPFLIFITMLGVSGAILGTTRFDGSQGYAIDRDTLLLPEIWINDYMGLANDLAVASALRPAFDAMWNACGYERSLDYDEKGKWNPDR